MEPAHAEPDADGRTLGDAPSFKDDGLTALRNGLRQACLAYITLILVWTSVEFFHPLVGLKGLDFCPMTFFVILLAAFGTALSRPRPLTLRQLRVYEASIFGAMTFFFFTNHIYWMQNGLLGEIAREGKERILMILIGDGIAFPWFTQLVIYGAFVPNTWRRCLIVTGGMGLIPILITPLDSPWADRIGRKDHHVALLVMSEWMVVGVAMAVYSSHKISRLRQEVREARHLGPYNLKRRLGAGGMGEVYLAEHRLLKRPCAVKVIRPERAGDIGALRRFEREVQATAALTHPNVVEVYDYGHEADGTFYYVMEYLPGLSLQELVERHGPLPPARAVHLLRQVCSALREAHAHGLVHRDVKPGNVLVCERGQVYDVAKLLDFGLVREQKTTRAEDDRLTQTGIMLGSPLYMAPEQVRGAEPDGRADLYALGLVAYFLMSGVHPFRRPTPQAVFAAQLSEPAPPLRDVCPEASIELEAVVRRCLEKNPADRYASAAELEAALANSAGPWSADDAETWWRLHVAS